MYAIRRLGDKDDEQTTDQLISLYDSEQDVQVKGSADPLVWRIKAKERHPQIDFDCS